MGTSYSATGGAGGEGEMDVEAATPAAPVAETEVATTTALGRAGSNGHTAGNNGNDAPPSGESEIPLPCEEKNRHRLSHNGLEVTFVNLHYSVPNRKNRSEEYEIVRDVTACFVPGEMTALMGPSGCGKTTLLDVLSGRKTVGTRRGSVLYGGRQPTEALLKSRCGYVEQFDTLVANLTVREMLSYTAELKRPMGESNADKRRVVDDTISLLRLGVCADTVIGDELHRGISGGQAKRTNIGLSLVADPQVIFLDEPTTGLDSFMANEVALCLRQIADSLDKTVCATIHSPTSYAFNLFDTLLLLGGDGLSRGRVAYFGPLGEGGSDVLRHFESLGYEFPRSAGAYSLVEWIVDVISGKYSLVQESVAMRRAGGEITSGVGAAAEGTGDERVQEGAEETGLRARPSKAPYATARSKSLAEVMKNKKDKGDDETDFAAAYAKSELKTQMWRRIRCLLLQRGYSASSLPENLEKSDQAGNDELERSLEDGPTEEPALQRARTVKKATAVPSYFALWVLLKYRASKNLRSIAFIAPRFADKMLTAFISATLFIGVGSREDVQSVGSTAAVLFMVVALNGFGAASYVPTLSLERALFYREMADGLYRSYIYLAYNLIEEVIISSVTSILYTLIVWWAIDLQGSLGIFFIIYFLSSFVGIAAAYTSAAVSPTLEVANALLPTYMIINLFFAGFLIPLDTIPRGWRWYSNIDPMRFGWEALMINNFQNSDPGAVEFINGETVLEYYGFANKTYDRYIGFLTLFIPIFSVFAWAALTFIRHGSR